MRKLVVWGTALIAVTAPATASYAGHGHGGGGGGGGGTPTFTLSIPADPVAVDQSLVQSVAITVTRAGASATSIKNCSSTVSVATTPNTDSGDGAAANTDYTAPTSVTIPKGALTADIAIGLAHESETAPDADTTESFNVTISNATSSCKKTSTIASASAVVTISDSRHAFHVPDGAEVQLSGILLGGCDPLYASFEVPGSTFGLGDNTADPCDVPIGVSDFRWKNDTGDEQIARLGLDDLACGVGADLIYYSDTTSAAGTVTDANHARVTPTSDPNVWTVDLADTGGGCNFDAGSWKIPPAGQGNMTATLRLVTSAPDAPTNPSATPNGSSEVDLQWDAMPTADSYEIWRGDAGTGSETFLDTTNTPSYTDTSVSADTTYDYYVKAVNDVGTSGPSQEVEATTTP